MMAKNFRSLKRIRPSDDRSCIVCFTAYRYNCFLLGVAKVGSGVFIGVEDGFAKALPKNRPVGVTTGIYLVMNSLHSVENIADGGAGFCGVLRLCSGGRKSSH